MNINQLQQKLNKIQENLSEETIKLKDLSDKIKKESSENNIDNYSEKTNHNISNYEKLYQEKNKKYKQLISQFSLAYLELTDFYVGPELPRSELNTFFDSKEDLNQLYFLFFMGFFMKHFIQ